MANQRGVACRAQGWKVHLCAAQLLQLVGSAADGFTFAISLKWLKGQLRRKMNLWSNYTLLPSQPLSDICFHDCRM